ncbi:MAG: DUF3883 domain-containing protein [Desulfarculus sp.]|nr:DUF3883 domain-containing protein [Desulfarculus sp.]
MRKAIFARIGWMTHYAGDQPGDEKPIGGGSYNEDGVGNEIYNFDCSKNTVRGFWQPKSNDCSISLDRIFPRVSKTAKLLKEVLVVFFAKHPEGHGQFVVGWYNDATVLKQCKLNGYISEKEKYNYLCEASKDNAVLLPPNSRTLRIPRGVKGTFGQANIFYLFDNNRFPRNADWIMEVLEYVDNYNGVNLVKSPEAMEVEKLLISLENAGGRNKGQGFNVDQEKKQIIDNYAMEKAISYYRKKGYTVVDNSKTNPYDLYCTNGEDEVYVEVKGTSGDGSQVILTPREVANVKMRKPHTALFVFYGIQVKETNGKLVATGGKPIVIFPWEIDKRHLEPISYWYMVP